MNQENQDNIKKVISVILLLFWCLLIFYFSNQTGDLSENSSNFVIDLINKLFNINLYNFDYSVFIVRKLAHMFLYFMLYLFSYNVCKNFKLKKIYLISLLFCLLYAISDEIHQLFILERSSNLIDIIIDMIGSNLGLIFIKIINYLKK